MIIEYTHILICRPPFIIFHYVTRSKKLLKIFFLCISVLCVLTCLVFVLPPSAPEKLYFGGICLILNMFLLMYCSRIIEHSSSHTPLISKLSFISDMIHKSIILSNIPKDSPLWGTSDVEHTHASIEIRNKQTSII